MLARIRKAMEEREEGFTLIELLVVIIIIGILAAIAIPIFLNQRKKAVEASQKSDLRTVANEMETYFTDQQSYPTQVNPAGTNTITLSQGGTSPVSSNIKVSSNDTVTLVAGTGATGAVKDGTYCLQSVNTNSSKTWFYDSDNGGISTACG